MSEALYSDHWHRIAELRPALRPHARIAPHDYRGQQSWVLRDELTGRVHRLNATTRFVLSMTDGRQTVAGIWAAAVGVLGQDAPSQDDMLGLLARLHGADLLVSSATPEVEELFRRHEARTRRRRVANLANPIFLRIPLYDPDRLLRALLARLEWLFRPAALLAWLALMIAGGIALATEWDSLVRYGDAYLLRPGNLALMLLAFPVLKALHELAHGLVVRRFGGEVHETGIVLLVLLPIPYVDASAATYFPAKSARIAVGVAGIVMELGLAVIALLAWLALDDGVLRLLMFDVLLIGGVASIAFNANPLMRFDGYYILADWLELPNLGRRARDLWAGWGQRLFLGTDVIPVPEEHARRGEIAWLASYGAAALAYRLTIVVAIAMYLMTAFPLLGALLAAWALLMMLVWPSAKSVLAVMRQGSEHGRTARVVARAGLLTGVAALFLFWLPLGGSSPTVGVVWPDDTSILRAGADCFVDRVIAKPGTSIEKGQVLVECADPVLVEAEQVLHARIAGLRAQLQGFPLRERVQRRILAGELEQLHTELLQAQGKVADLTVRASATGEFLLHDPGGLDGRYFAHGEVIGFVVNPGTTSIRTVLQQDQIALLAADRSNPVRVRFSDSPAEVFRSRIVSVVPSATMELPSAALGSSSGGPVVVDADDERGLRVADDGVYEVELALPPGLAPERIGARVAVQIEHDAEPLAARWWRDARRTLMARLGV